MSTIYVTHPRYPEHDFPGHPEHAGRIQAVWKQLELSGLTDRMKQATAPSAITEQIQSVHTARYLDLVARTAGQARLTRLDADTYTTPTSYEVALLAAGGVIHAVDAVLAGHVNNGIAAVRPPGHHAMPDRAMGFCLFGNIAVAARFAQHTHHLDRIMIVDYDVHHGNGTEAMFYTDNTVLFVSTHQSPLYPGTGAPMDVGRGAGKGFNVNIPLAPGNGDTNYAALYKEVIWKLAERYQPQLILVSAGFDAHWRDPLAHINLSLSGYAHISRELILMAEAYCGGKIVFVMEGGYDLDVLSYGWANIARALLGDDDIADPLGSVADEPPVAPVIERIQQIHGLS